MQDILYELHRAEGILQEQGYRVDQHETYSEHMASILRKYGVTQESFDSSLMWYTRHPAQFETMYPNVIKRLEADVATLNANTQGSAMGETLASHHIYNDYHEAVYVLLFKKDAPANIQEFQHRFYTTSDFEIKYYCKWKYRFLYLKYD